MQIPNIKMYNLKLDCSHLLCQIAIVLQATYRKPTDINNANTLLNSPPVR